VTRALLSGRARSSGDVNPNAHHMLEDNIAHGLRHDFTDAELINLAELAKYAIEKTSYRVLQEDVGVTED